LAQVAGDGFPNQATCAASCGFQPE